MCKQRCFLHVTRPAPTAVTIIISVITGGRAPYPSKHGTQHNPIGTETGGGGGGLGFRRGLSLGGSTNFNAFDSTVTFAANFVPELLRVTANHRDGHDVILLVVHLVSDFSCSQKYSSPKKNQLNLILFSFSTIHMYIT